ncbi:S8 family peptidase [Arenimonas sp.]|uniref:S8 family peptidase n=1 Tax=Arenimonas sp. TaxID=1872635 RepID=UPI0035ADE944
MSTSNRKQRLRALVVATALAFGATPAFAGLVNTGGLEENQQYDRFIIKLKADAMAKSAAEGRLDGVLATANLALQALGPAPGGVVAKSSAGGAQHLRTMSLGADVVSAGRQLDAAQALAVMEAIAALPEVESVEVDALMQADFVPNDTYYYLQWGYNDADAGIRADAAWDIANGEGIVVAVLDTGITNHSDLNANILPGYDMIWDPEVSVDGDGRDADPSDPGDYWAGRPTSSWHGTHVAGTIAAVTNNAKGVAGTAWGAKVMPVRVLGRYGGYTSDIADGITWASGGNVPDVPSLEPARVADVINMSLGGSGACGIYQEAIDGANARGTTVVVSAGNDNFDAINKRPANCGGVISVASITSASARSGFSNYGASVDIAAPGSTIASTLNAGATVPAGEGYAYYSGTSMAAPHVAGAIALAQSRRLTLGLPLWTPAQAEAQVKATAYAMAVPCPEGCGAGIVNAHALALAAGGGPLQAELGAYLSERPAAITYGREATFGIQVRSRGPEVAPGTRLDVAVSNRVQSVEPMAPAGWSCSELEPSRTMRNFRCEFGGAYPDGRNDTLRFKVRTLRSTTVAMEGRVSSEAVDDRPTNNRVAMTFIVGQGSY